MCGAVRSAISDGRRTYSCSSWLRSFVGDRPRYDLCGNPAGSATHQTRNRISSSGAYNRHFGGCPICPIRHCIRRSQCRATNRWSGRRSSVWSADGDRHGGGHADSAAHGGLLLLVTTIISVISAQVSQESTKWSARFVREFRSIPSSVRRRRPEVRRAR
jgi:hypothetical protein